MHIHLCLFWGEIVLDTQKGEGLVKQGPVVRAVKL